MASEPEANHTQTIKPEPDTESAAQRAHKRRPHTKSRNGCTTCKRRRVKCDETRPVCRNCQHLRLECRYVAPAALSFADLQIMNLKLLHHYDRVVAKTIADAGISTEQVWANDVVEMGFKFPFLMHAILMFSATHLVQREPKEYCSAVVQHRSEALVLLRSEVQRINSTNLDALVATSVLLILDAMANAALPAHMMPCSLPASTWLHHVRGAATILLAVGVLPPTSKFYSFMGVDMLDLANCYPGTEVNSGLSSLQCVMPELSDLYPVPFDSPYFSSLAFLDKLHQQRRRVDFILRVFSFPALMDKEFVRLLASGDDWAKRIVSAYYRLVRSYVREMHDTVWFLNGVSTVLPIDMDSQFGGLGFVTDALPVSRNVDSILAKFDASFAAVDNSAAEASQAPYFDDAARKTEDVAASAPTSSGPSPTTAPGSATSSLSASPTNMAQSPPIPLTQQMSGQQMAGQQMASQPSMSSQQPLGSEMIGGPHTYGRIRKQGIVPAHQEHVPMPGSGQRASGSSFGAPRPRPMFNSAIRPLGGRNRNIIRPGMMGLPVDPSIPDDLLGDFDVSSILGDDMNFGSGYRRNHSDQQPMFAADPESTKRGGDYAPLQGHPFMPQPPLPRGNTPLGMQPQPNASGTSAYHPQPMQSHMGPRMDSNAALPYQQQQSQQQPRPHQQPPPQHPQSQPPQGPSQPQPSTYGPHGAAMVDDAFDLLTPEALLSGGDIPLSILGNDLQFSANSSRISSISPQENASAASNYGTADSAYISPRNVVGGASQPDSEMVYIKEEPNEAELPSMVSYDEDLPADFGDDVWEAA